MALVDDQIVRIRDKLFLHIEGKQESFSFAILDILSFGTPWIVSEASYGFSEFGTDEDESVSDVITFFMKS